MRGVASTSLDADEVSHLLIWLWLWLLILGAPLTTLAERRLESVGNPAGRRVSRPAPWMARGGGPRIQAGVREHRAQARCRGVGQEPFAYFWALKSEPPSGRNHKWPLPQEWICTPPNPTPRSAHRPLQSCVDTYAAKRPHTVGSCTAPLFIPPNLRQSPPCATRRPLRT